MSDFLYKLVLTVFRRFMNRYVSMVLDAAYEERVLSSKNLHILSSYFDSTQTVLFLKKSIYTDMRQRKNAGTKMWKCNSCGNVEYTEAEVSCWMCSEGEMIFYDERIKY